MAAAMDGCALVYHVAGINTMCPLDPAALFHVNVRGAEAAVRAAARAGVPRVVLTSSAAALGEAAGTIGRRGLAAPRQLPVRLRALQARGRAGRVRRRPARRPRARVGEPLVRAGPGPRGRHGPDHDRLPQRPPAGVRRHDDQHRRHRRLRGRPRARGGARAAGRALRDLGRHAVVARGARDRDGALGRAPRRAPAPAGRRAAPRARSSKPPSGCAASAAGVPGDGRHAAPRAPLRRLARGARARASSTRRWPTRSGGRSSGRAPRGSCAASLRRPPGRTCLDHPDRGAPPWTSAKRPGTPPPSRRRTSIPPGPSRPRKGSRRATTSSPTSPRRCSSPTSRAGSPTRSRPARSTTGRFSEGQEELPDSPEKHVERRFSEGIEQSPTSE